MAVRYKETEVSKLLGIQASHIRECEIAADRAWLIQAMKTLEADTRRTSDTHLLRLDFVNLLGIDLYLKDESTHLTGSLKHRLARSLILYGLCNGRIGRATTLIEASSGSTAVSEAYFAKLIGLKFVAVVPKGTSERKLNEIRRYGGHIHEVKASDIYDAAEALSRGRDAYYLDQFTNAERATDWRGNNNIAESLFEQMAQERFPVPDWVVVGAGTGGTSATLGRYIRFRGDALSTTRLCVADPENSAFFIGYQQDTKEARVAHSSRIEGVGRPRLEPSFLPSVVDRMVRVADAASFATCWRLLETTGRRYGPSTGLNVYAALQLAREMQSAGREGSIVCLGCDNGNRYNDTCYDRSWLQEQGLEIEPYVEEFERIGTAS